MIKSSYSEKSGENYGFKLYMHNIFFIYWVMANKMPARGKWKWTPQNHHERVSKMPNASKYHLWLEFAQKVPTQLVWFSEIEETPLCSSGCLRAFPDRVTYTVREQRPGYLHRSLGRVCTQIPWGRYRRSSQGCFYIVHCHRVDCSAHIH